jgi:hypothetical protein
MSEGKHGSASSASIHVATFKDGAAGSTRPLLRSESLAQLHWFRAAGRVRDRSEPGAK